MSTARNCSDIGINTQNILKRLFANQDLLKLLYYSDKTPLAGADLTDEQIKSDIYEKLIKVVPRVGAKETAQAVVVVRISRGETDSNNQFRNLTLVVENFVPLSQWIIKDSNLRPFAIMGEIERSLKDKDVEGLGKITGGDFSLNFLTEEISCYIQTFEITTYA